MSIVEWSKNSLESDNMVSGLHICNAFAHRLDYASAFMAQHYRESTFRILSRECVGIGMANSSVVYLNPHFMRLRGLYFNVFDS